MHKALPEPSIGGLVLFHGGVMDTVCCQCCKRRRLGSSHWLVVLTPYGNERKRRYNLCRECRADMRPREKDRCGTLLSYGWGSNEFVRFGEPDEAPLIFPRLLDDLPTSEEGLVLHECDRCGVFFETTTDAITLGDTNCDACEPARQREVLARLPALLAGLASKSPPPTNE